MNWTTAHSPVIMKMRSCYLNATEKFEKEELKKSNIWAAKEYLNNKFSQRMKVTEHAALRLWQRLDENEARHVLAEVTSIAKSGMHKKLFVGKQRNINVILLGDITVGFALSKDRIVLKTVFKRKQ